MSKNRKYTRSIKLPRKIQGEINAAKRLCQTVYGDMKREIIVGTSGGTMDQTGVRERIMEAKREFNRRLPIGGPKSGFQLARLAYFRALDLMLAKVGGPVKSADDLFDESMAGGMKTDDVSEESINQAMQMLGMLPPEGSGAPGATTPAGDTTTDHAPDATPKPRFRRSYDVPPADEGPAGSGPNTSN